MVINGFQKMTLLDFPNKVACTIFTGGCNFRCPFCHNALLVTSDKAVESYTEEEILSFLQKRQGLLDGVAITGGEPLLQNDIELFIKKVKDLGFLVKLDTNGYFPEKLQSLIDKNLIDYVAMDIKNSKQKYLLTTGIGNLDITNIEKSVNILLQDKIPYEFRTTVVKEFHTEQDIQDIVVWINGAHNYYLQNFEDSGNLIGTNLSAVSPLILQNMRKIALKHIKNVQVRGL